MTPLALVYYRVIQHYRAIRPPTMKDNPCLGTNTGNICLKTLLQITKIFHIVTFDTLLSCKTEKG